MIIQSPTVNRVRFAGVLTFLIFALTLLKCQPKSAEAIVTTDTLAQATEQPVSIVSFEALFAPGQYENFLDTYWNGECQKRWYQIAKASDRDLPCKCSDILLTISANLDISLNNMNCFPPEMTAEGHKLEHYVSVPLESLRPYLSEEGKKIVFESGTQLKEWLVEKKKIATTVEPSPYTFFVSGMSDGKRLRIVLQSREGKNYEEGSITGYIEMTDGSKIEVTGYREWGGFVVYDRTKDASTGAYFTWSDERGSDTGYQHGNRFVDASYNRGTLYIEALLVTGAQSLYEGPEDEVREPENGTPDTGN
jgi:hypothetical protein